MPLDILTRSEINAPASLNPEKRTVDAILSTGAGVPRFDFEGEYVEKLEISPDAIDLTRAEGGPVLDSHRQDGLDKVLGRLANVRIENGQLIGTLEISPRHNAVLEDIGRGIIRGVSIGYSIEAFRDELDPQNGKRQRIATKWTLIEASLVAVPADAASTLRSMAMPTPQTPPPSKGGKSNTSVDPGTITTRANVNAEIRSIAQTFDLSQTFIDDLIDRNATVEEARAAALGAIQEQRTATPQPRVSHVSPVESPQERINAMGEAMYARSNTSHDISEHGRAYANMTLSDVAKDCLVRSGISTTGLSASEVVTRAFQSTSDYPAVFADTVNRSLMDAYNAAPSTLKAVAKRSSARDFRRKTKVQIGEAPTLEKVNENGEYKYGGFAEAKESYAIDTFGRITGFSRKAAINDDIGALVDPASKLGQAASEFEAQFLVDLLEANGGAGPNMDDNQSVFHTGHANIAASGGALNEETLSSARLSMRKQTGLSGQRINVAPKFLIVPPELETTAERLLAAIQPTKSDDVNPFASKLSLLVEARLSSPARWYMVADPKLIEGLEYSYLQGEEGPQIETRSGFEVDGMEYKVRLDFGAAFMDWRGWYMNPGEKP